MGQFTFVHIAVAAGLAAATISVIGVVRDVGAADSGTPSVFVPIVPCRLADTRAGASNVGARNTPVGPAETLQLAVRGSNGNCAIPNTATGIAANVTAVGPTADSYLTVFPADANPRPTASNLNVTSTSPPTSNQVTVALSATGAIAVYNNGGNVNVIVDIAGYYEPSTGSGTGLAGVTPQDVIWVAKSGGQFTSVSAAMNSITGGGPHLISVAPGTYVETAPIIMKNNVDLAGSGQDRTTITCACAIALASGSRSTVFVNGGVSAEIRDITLSNSGGAANVSVALELNLVTAEISVVDTTLIATNGAGPSFSAMALWIGSGSDHPHIDNINTHTSGAPTNYGVYTQGDDVTIRNSTIVVDGAGYSVYNTGPGIRLLDSTVKGPTSQLVGRCANVFDINNDVYTCA